MNWVMKAFDAVDQRILRQSDLAYEAKGSFEGNPAYLKLCYWKTQKSWFANFLFQDEEGESQATLEDKQISWLVKQVFANFDFRIHSDRAYSQVVRDALYHQFSFVAGDPLEQHLFDTRRSEVAWCLAQRYIDTPYTERCFLIWRTVSQRCAAIHSQSFSAKIHPDRRLPLENAIAHKP